MSAVCILTPVVIAAWPAFSAAVVAAASSLGYTVVDQALDALSTQSSPARVQLEIPQSELVTDRLARAKELSVSRDGVTITFSRDARGRAAVCVSGEGQSKQELQALGSELAGRVVQQYVYQRLKEEMAARQFLVVEEETDATAAIRLKVRHWEN
ncbi:MAG: hypothetical protein JNN07_06125 [Verrucomicrobiales bacterium]|nr:hypothetical protein [Verrucomicrobiales bacterium]